MKRILVIDDEQVVLDAARRILMSEGFEVLRTLDAETAIALMETAKPDIVVVDLKLPGMSGLDFMESTRPENPDLVFIVMTGVSSADQAIAALNFGAFDFLPKPFTFEELLSPIFRAARFVDLHEAAIPVRGYQSPDDRFFLGMQSWARPEDDGSIRVGVSSLFEKTAGEIRSVVLPELEGHLRQGGPMATVSTADGRSHVVLSPVSGTVLMVNEALSKSGILISAAPTARGWLAIVQPADLEHELGNLRHITA